jgi:hypothetical protein
MAKSKEGWTRGVGPYSGGDDVKLNRKPDRGYPEPRDISRKVDRNSKVDDGFSGKLSSDD